MTWVPFSTTLLIVAAASVFAAAVITLDSITVPRNAQVGDTVTLDCPYSIDPVDSPHTVKWWRNNDQFYQFVSPKGNSFHVAGIAVDLTRSDARQVTLQLSSVASSGDYKCQVMLDETTESTSRARYMAVSEEPPPITAAPKPVAPPKPVATPKPVEPPTPMPPPKTAGASGIMGESLLHKVLLTLLAAAIARLFRP